MILEARNDKHQIRNEEKMNPNGLHNQLAVKRRSLEMARAVERTSPNPQDCHQAGIDSERLTREIKQLEHTILELEDMIGNLSGMIGMLRDIPQGGAHSTLAMRHLEDARSRLFLELGTKA